MPDSIEKPFKIVLAGGVQVGKTRIALWLKEALKLDYIAQSPSSKHLPFDIYQNTYYTLFDLKHPIQYPATKHYYKNTHILLACFNGEKPETLDPLRRPVKEILDYAESPIILLVNNQKRELLDNKLIEQSEKKLAAFLDVNDLNKNNIFHINAHDNNSIERLVDEISTLTLKNRLLKNRLQTYISRIESHADKNAPDKINFAYGFHLFKSIRAKNREANYQLAKQLLEKLNQGMNADILFPQAKALRKPYQPHWFFNHGIQSKELKTIIERKPKPSR